MTDNGRVASEPALPEVIAEHRDGARIASPVLVRGETAPARHVDAEQLEEIAAHQQRAGGADRVCRPFAHFPRRERRDAFKRDRALRQIAHVGDRERRSRTRLTLRVAEIEPDHARGILDAGPRPQHDAGEDGDERRVQADDRGQHQQDDRRESRLAPQVAARVDRVLPDALEPRPDPDGAALFTRERRVAEAAPAAHGAMKLHLLGEFGFDLPLMEQVPDATEKLSHVPSPHAGPERAGLRASPDERGLRPATHERRPTIAAAIPVFARGAGLSGPPHAVFNTL